MEKEKDLEITISKIDSRCFLKISSEQIEISDYKIQSSADGTTELVIVIKGKSSVFESLASLKPYLQ